MAVELVNAAKMVNFHDGPRLANKQGDLSMMLVVTEQVHQKRTGSILLRGNNKERDHERTKDSHCGNSGLGGSDGANADRPN